MVLGCMLSQTVTHLSQIELSLDRSFVVGIGPGAQYARLLHQRHYACLHVLHFVFDAGMRRREIVRLRSARGYLFATTLCRASHAETKTKLGRPS